MSKLYVGNLSFNTTEQDLNDAFAAYQPTAVNLLMDRATGRSKGFAFVTCGTDELAQDAIQSKMELGGRTLKIDMARPPSESRGSNGGGFGTRRSGGNSRSSYGGGYSGGGRGGYSGR